MIPTRYSDLPYIKAGGDGGVRSTNQMIVIHATDNTASADSEANYATHREDKTSAHFYVDQTQVIQALPTDHVAYGCYPTGNGRSIQFELCGLSNHLTDATLRRAAPIVARVCRDWGLPVAKLSPAELVAGRKGICGHGDVTDAWHEGDHTDPGASFPWATFISYVNEGEDDVGDTEAIHNASENAFAVLTGHDAQVYPNNAPGSLLNVGNPLWKLLAELRDDLTAAKAAPVPVALSDAQLDELAQKVAALVPAAPSAAQVAEELAKRLGDG